MLLVAKLGKIFLWMISTLATSQNCPPPGKKKTGDDDDSK